MTDGDTEEETAAPVAGPSVPRNVEGPPTLGAWLGQTHNETGATRLEWQQSCASHIRKPGLYRRSMHEVEKNVT